MTTGAPADDQTSRAASGWRGTVAVHALGCKANQEEMECLLSRLVEEGFSAVPFGEPADWTLVNTCTVTAAADSDSRQWIRRAARAKGTGRLVVTGCLAQRDPRTSSAIEGVDWVVGNGEKPTLADLILDHGDGSSADSCTRIMVGADPTLSQFADYGTATEGRRTRATLKVQDGCDEHCTFCVIPQVRGASRSRPIADAVRQAETLVESGYHEIALTGINTALWGLDFDPAEDLFDLIAALEAVDGLERIRLNSLEPQYVTDEWLDRMAATKKLCRHLHLPLQSGDDSVLRRMNRRYDRTRYADVVQAAKKKMPDLAIGADVMVGFPGETDEQFQSAREYIESLPLAYLHVFSYSPRPDTASPKMGDAVEVDVRKQRSASLRGLSNDLKTRFQRSQLGSTQTVIPETMTRDGLWQGLTGNYIRVRFPWGSSGAPDSTPHPVVLERLDDDGFARGQLDRVESHVSARPAEPRGACS